MILTEKQKSFIIRNKIDLISLFKARVEELKEEIINEDASPQRDAKILLIREFLTMIKDVNNMTVAGEATKPRNLI